MHYHVILLLPTYAQFLLKFELMLSSSINNADAINHPREVLFNYPDDGQLVP